MSPFRVLMVRPLSTSWWRFIHCVCGEVALASLTAEGQSIQGGELYMALWSGGGGVGGKEINEEAEKAYNRLHMHQEVEEQQIDSIGGEAMPLLTPKSRSG